MTDCSSIHGSTSSSSDVVSSRSGVVTSRIRVIRLVRPSSKRILLGPPDNNVAFGFAIRGGKEFGTGFFVSRIEKGSEADIKGLKVGDQIIRVNGYHVDDAIHKELTHFVSSQDRLTLKVRGVGMLPIKEKAIDPLTWHIIPRHILTSVTGLDDLVPKDVRIVLKVAPKTKLGLGICKGPEWKPGIFVQFTKEFSVARDAGLQPGDQILSCNSIDFSDVLFSEAVAVMKSAQTLEMMIRTGAGLDLFPGESSGYNSSASSVTGDQSPCWGDQASKRLSIVREESQFWSDRNTLDRRKELPHLPPSVFVPKNEVSEGTRLPSDSAGGVGGDIANNKTIIQLFENGTLINNTLISNNNGNVHSPGNGLSAGTENITIKQNCNVSSPTGSENIKMNFITGNCLTTAEPDRECNNQPNSKIADICFVSRQSETKTVIVEVHRSEAEENNQGTSATGGNSSNIFGPPEPPPKPPVFPSSEDSRGSLSIISTGSSDIATSLSSAINEELKKRQKRRTCSEETNQQRIEKTIDSESQPRHTPKRLDTVRPLNASLGGNDEKRHNALMDEFKRAHRRMFKNGFKEDEKEERQEELNKAIVMKDEVDRAHINGHVKTDNLLQFSPPPPPPPFNTGHIKQPITIHNNLKQNLPISHQKQREQSKTVSTVAAVAAAPPVTPTPDYDSSSSSSSSALKISKHTNNNCSSINQNQSMKGTIGRVISAEMAKVNGDTIDMESIESYKLQNIPPAIPHPPSLYFNPQSSGPPTMKKISRPVSVTIEEYGGKKNRKEPSKFDFIKSNIENGNIINNYSSNNLNASSNAQQQIPKDENVSEMFRSELEKTLSRSNLKKKNEIASNGILNLQSVKNGGVVQAAGKPMVQKTQSSNIEKIANMLQNRQNSIEINGNGTMNNGNNRNGSLIGSSNRVTINIPNKIELRKTESTPPTIPTNGILKNGYNKPNLGEKSITFGN